MADASPEKTDPHARLRRALAGLALISGALGGVIVWAAASDTDGVWHAPVFNTMVLLAAALAAGLLQGAKRRVPAAVVVAGLSYHLVPLWLSYAWEPNHTDDSELTGEAGPIWDVWDSWPQTGAEALAGGYSFLLIGAALLVAGFAQPRRVTDAKALAALGLALVFGIAGLAEMSWTDGMDDYGDDTYSINLVYANHVMPFTVRMGGQFFVGMALFAISYMHKESALWMGLSMFVNSYIMGYCTAYANYQNGELLFFLDKLDYCADGDELCVYYQHQVNAYALLATGAALLCFLPVGTLAVAPEGWRKNAAPSRPHLAVAALAFFFFFLATVGVTQMGNNATTQPRYLMLGSTGVGMFACAFFAAGLLLTGPLAMALRALGLGMAYSNIQQAASFMAFPNLFVSDSEDGPNWAPTVNLIAAVTLFAAMPCDLVEASRHLRASLLGLVSAGLLVLAFFLMIPFFGDAWDQGLYSICEDGFAFVGYETIALLFVVGGVRQSASRGFRALALFVIVLTGMLAGGFFDYWVNVSRTADGVDADERTLIFAFLFATVGCALGLVGVVKAGGDWASDDSGSALAQTLTEPSASTGDSAL